MTEIEPRKVVANELIPVYETDLGERIVDARELHEFLGVGRDFTNWIKDRIQKYDFIEGKDFSPNLAKTQNNGRPRTDYALKLGMAKELGMIEDNEQGRRIRKYFIAIEERVVSMMQVPSYAIEDPVQRAQRWIVEQQQKQQVEHEIKLLQDQAEADRPKIIFAEALETSGSSILIGELAKLLKQNGIDIGQNRLFENLRRDGYLGNRGEYRNMPTQRSMDQKLFEIKTRTINNPDGSVRTTRTTKVTGKGQSYFINKYKEAQ